MRTSASGSSAGEVLVTPKPVASPNAPRDQPHPLVAVLRMALGDGEGAPRTADAWWDAYRLATRERCAGLVWLRCGAAVRGQAPPDVVREWRATVVHQYWRGEMLLSRVAQTTARLTAHGVPWVMLKGAPLAAHLYGDPLVRPLDDVDLLVSRADWRRAVEVLEQDGWSKEQGRQGWSEIYRRVDAGEILRLDLQPSLLVDHLDHLPEIRGIPTACRWGESVVPAYLGPELAVFLAVHLLKHQLPPVLWLIDFHTCWSGMSESQRSEAMDIAVASRVNRYLRWAVTHSSRLLDASHGKEAALRGLGFHPAFRRDNYGMLRLTGFAASLPDMVSVLGAWAWPRPLRYDWAAFGRMWKRRSTKSIARVFQARRIYLDPRDRSDTGAAASELGRPSPDRSREAY